MTAASWFSKTSDSARPTAKKPLPKTIFARRTGKLRSELVIFLPKTLIPPEPGEDREIFSLKHCPPSHRRTSSVPFSPAPPFSPHSGPAQRLFQEHPAESKFLATASSNKVTGAASLF